MKQFNLDARHPICTSVVALYRYGQMITGNEDFECTPILKTRERSQMVLARVALIVMVSVLVVVVVIVSVVVMMVMLVVMVAEAVVQVVVLITVVVRVMVSGVVTFIARVSVAIRVIRERKRSA